MPDTEIDPTWRDDIEHCIHPGSYTDDDPMEDDAYCVHCECCCTCLGCEYGPRDGMLMFPAGVEQDGQVASDA
ncbi:MAG TPA: hypothetical protein VGW74_02670 [Propionibacteriaceae bacterium]|nr:hypothetical protein [Propionibacteriaceae bacterium]